MAKKNDRPIVISISGLSKKEKKQVTKRMTHEVVHDKQYRKTLRHSETPIPKEVAKAAAKAAVDATLGVKSGEPAVPEKKSGLEIYTELVGKFAAARKTYRKKQKKKLKAAKKQGYDAKTGLYKLKRADKVKLAKKAKPYKAKKKKK